MKVKNRSRLVSDMDEDEYKDQSKEDLIKQIEKLKDIVVQKALTEDNKKVSKKTRKSHSDKKQKEVLTISQIRDFIDKSVSIQDKLMIKCMLKCGLRVSEVVNFTIEWINFKDNIIRIRSNIKPIKWEPKYCSERELPIPESLSIELKQFIGNRKKGYVFKSRKKSNYNRYNTDSIIHKINRLSREIIGHNTGTHIFRRTYASYLVSNKIDIVVISRYMGHSDVKHTFDYLKSIPDRSGYDEVRGIDIMNI